MTLLALIRHGPTAWNAAKKTQGRTDVPLSDEGRAAVRAWRLPDTLAHARAFSSPLVRARETAALLFGSFEIEPRLVEMSWGAWEGRTLADLRAERGAAMAENEARGLDFRPAGGESPREVQARVLAWIGEMAAQGQTCAAVTHRGVIRVVAAHALGWDMTGKPPVKLRADAAHLFDIAPEEVRVRALNVALAPEKV